LRDDVKSERIVTILGAVFGPTYIKIRGGTPPPVDRQKKNPFDMNSVEVKRGSWS
jgi:hypothetical protein